MSGASRAAKAVTNARSRKPGATKLGGTARWPTPWTRATSTARRSASGAKTTSASVKRSQSPCARPPPAWQAWFFPSQPSGSARTWSTASRGSAAASPSRIAPVPSLERSSTATTSSSTPSCASSERIARSTPAASSRHGTITLIRGAGPGRDEAAGVERAMRSLLAQDGVELEVVAVDDRSSDGTGAILDGLAAADPRLAVLHVRALPDGWLGKNHACHAGAGRAQGDWLLFTDADVVFAPEALRRAVDAARAHGLGHLAVPPRLVAPGFLERAFVSAFAALLAPLVRIADLRRPGTRAYFGVGAFNLVRRDAYARSGGHLRLPLEVVDDLKLGLLLRRSGVAQGVARSDGLVEVRWHEGFVRSVLGLVKNAFAALEYRPALAAAAAGRYS